MTKNFQVLGYDQNKTLFVFALESEAAEVFENCNKLIMGIGKISATYALMNAIYRERPFLIVNLGSAGSNEFARGSVVCCTRFVQRDMNVTGLGYEKYETPYAETGTSLEYGIAYPGLPLGVCGSGDSFEMNHFSTDYNVVDMEAYPLALIAMREQIPFLCLKYISDGADGSAAEEWSVQVHHAAEAFRKILFV
ncbi:MAG: hypothetical protein QM727_13800 [Niabella sp.]